MYILWRINKGDVRVIGNAIVRCVIEFNIQKIIEKRQTHKIKLKEIELEILKEKRKW